MWESKGVSGPVSSLHTLRGSVMMARSTGRYLGKGQAHLHKGWVHNIVSHFFVFSSLETRCKLSTDPLPSKVELPQVPSSTLRQKIRVCTKLTPTRAVLSQCARETAPDPTTTDPRTQHLRFGRAPPRVRPSVKLDARS